jgi:xanthine dehydrogenase YagS FAD-binding subunit
MLPDFAYLRARTRKEAIEHLSQPGSYVLAGGTDLQGCLRDGILEASKVISLSALDELQGIEQTANGGLRIGALTTVTEVAKDAQVATRFPGLSMAAGAVASPQLRNQGTIGGNLCQRPRCWYFRGEFNCMKKGGDTCYAESGQNRYHAIMGGTPCYIVHPSDTAPMLMAMNATLQIDGPSGTRNVSLSEFFVLPEDDVLHENVLRPGEIVTDILLPAPAAGTSSLYRKVRERGAWDFALASVALVLQMSADRVTSARVVLGGVAPVPWHLTDVEDLLRGRVIDEDLAREAGRVAIREAEPLDHNAYKVRLVEGIVAESLLKLAQA